MKSYDYLISYNIKPSVQRIAIMDYLLAHKTHPSIDEIYLALCKDIPTLSKTTVYNTLKLFVEHGAALMLTIDEKNACFDGDTSLHAHFLCKKFFTFIRRYEGHKIFINLIMTKELIICISEHIIS